jgi:uncharacterized protein (DUF697 family)/tellurite resistance protein
MISETEAVASLKILAAVAKADGAVHKDELRSLAAAIESLSFGDGSESSRGALPETQGFRIEELIEQDIDLDAELALLKSDEAREQIYRSAYFMAHADGACTPEETAVLEEIAAATQVTAEQRAALDRLFARSPDDSLLPGKLQRIDDPELRASEVRKTVRKYAVITAALGAFPIPGVAIATDLAVIALQVKMVGDIGHYWGHTVDRKAAKSMLYGLGLGTGARLAVANIAKLLPGWGSAVGGATSFASTYALGKVLETFFAEDAKGDIARLRDDLRAAEKEGKAAYAEQRDEIATKATENRAAIEKLTADVHAGRITQAELERRLAELP